MTMNYLTRAGLSALSFFGVLSPLIAPMARVSDKYDLHLWPQNDALKYQPTDLQRHCQNLHIATGVVFGVAILLTIVHTALRPALSARPAYLGAHFATLLGGALYLAAVGTLVALVKDVKDNLDDIPVPIPNISVRAAAGTYLDAVGMLAAGGASVLALYALVTGARDDYQELD